MKAKHSLYCFIISLLLQIRQRLCFTIEQNFRDFQIISFNDKKHYSEFLSTEDIISNYFMYNDRLVLGYFITETLSLNISYSKYSAIGINFNLYFKTSAMNNYIKEEDDDLNMFFSIKNTVVSYNILNQKPARNVVDLGSDSLYKFNISLTHQHVNNINYLPIMFNMSSNSSLEWAISDFYILLVNCPSKCPSCNLTNCISCSSNSDSYFNQALNLCVCNNGFDLWDYSDSDKPINCLRRYIPYYYDVFNQYYLNSSWIYNGNPITPYDLSIYCSNISQIFFGNPNGFYPLDTLSINTPVNRYYSSYELKFGLVFFNRNNKNKQLSLYTSSDGNSINRIISANNNIVICNQDLTFSSDIYNFTNLTGNPYYINTTFVLENNNNNNIALSYFNLSISPCFPSCKTCSNPSFNSCLSCADENSYLINGECKCNDGMLPDITDSVFICVGN